MNCRLLVFVCVLYSVSVSAGSDSPVKIHLSSAIRSIKVDVAINPVRHPQHYWGRWCVVIPFPFSCRAPVTERLSCFSIPAPAVRMNGSSDPTLTQNLSRYRHWSDLWIGKGLSICVMAEGNGKVLHCKRDKDISLFGVWYWRRIFRIHLPVMTS